MMDEANEEVGRLVAGRLPLQGVTVVVTRAAVGDEKPPPLEQVVDADIAEFEEYFCKMLKNSSLAAPEKAILKTYLYWKTHPAEPSGSAD